MADKRVSVEYLGAVEAGASPASTNKTPVRLGYTVILKNEGKISTV
jgi:hypothetical protein